MKNYKVQEFGNRCENCKFGHVDYFSKSVSKVICCYGNMTKVNLNGICDNYKPKELDKRQQLEYINIGS
jgi:hypothetical protein